MLKINLQIPDLEVLTATIVPFLTLLLVQIISPVWRAVTDNAPGRNANLLMPTSVQSTAYTVMHPRQRR